MHIAIFAKSIELLYMIVYIIHILWIAINVVKKREEAIERYYCFLEEAKQETNKQEAKRFKHNAINEEFTAILLNNILIYEY